LVEYRSFKRRYSVRYVPHTNCVDNDSTFASSVALSIGCRNSRIPLGERTISNGNTTAWGPRKGNRPLWGEEEQRNE